MDQARLQLRDLVVKHPRSELRPLAYYLAGYSYYLEKRYDMALYAFRQTAKEYPGTPIAARALFFVADTLEEQGRMAEALKTYRALQERHPSPDVIEKRIRTLQARIRRGVR